MIHDFTFRIILSKTIKSVNSCFNDVFYGTLFFSRKQYLKFINSNSVKCFYHYFRNFSPSCLWFKIEPVVWLSCGKIVIMICIWVYYRFQCRYFKKICESAAIFCNMIILYFLITFNLTIIRQFYNRRQLSAILSRYKFSIGHCLPIRTISLKLFLGSLPDICWKWKQYSSFPII
jgi:hypothetical protein